MFIFVEWRALHPCSDTSLAKSYDLSTPEFLLDRISIFSFFPSSSFQLILLQMSSQNEPVDQLQRLEILNLLID